MSAKDNDICLFETRNGSHANTDATQCEITCGFCGTTHNLGADGEENQGEVWARHIEIFGTTVVFCCFDKLELLLKGLFEVTNAPQWLQEQLKEGRNNHQKKALENQEMAKFAKTLGELLG